MGKAEVAPLLVLGLGNLLLKDDGVGLVLLRKLCERYEGNPDVEFVDGGTLGVSLLALFDKRQAVLLLDAVSEEAGENSSPGCVICVEDPLVHPTRQEMGAHGANASGLLASAMLLGELPQKVRVVGVVPAELNTCVGLSLEVERALPEATRRADAVFLELLEYVRKGVEEFTN